MVSNVDVQLRFKWFRAEDVGDNLFKYKTFMKLDSILKLNED